MRLEITKLADMAEYDGGIAAVLFECELTKIVTDLHERPATETARVLTLEIKIVPVVGADGTLADVKVHVVMPSAKLPPSKTREISCGTLGNRGLVYNDLAPDNHNQHTIDEELEKTEGT